MKGAITAALISAITLCALPLAACDGCNGEQDTRSRYDLSVRYDGSGKLEGTLDFTYYNNTDNELPQLKFNLWGNAYREGAAHKPVPDSSHAKAYYDGESYGGERVNGVENCAEWEVCGEDNNILCVTLKEPVYPEQTASVKISYELTLAKVNHRTGITAHTVNLGNFYPVLCAYTAQGFAEYPYASCGDPFVSECADYSVKLTAPDKYTVASSGRQLSRKKTGENFCAEYELCNARDFAFVLSDEFKVSERQVGGTELKLYYRGEEKKSALDAAALSLEYFNSVFGKYPYPTLSVAMTDLCTGGMEYPALTMISEGADEIGEAYTVVHENAHQWWYAAVGSDQYNCGWQDEGLAEYSSLMFFEAHPEYGITRTSMLGSATKAYRAYYSVYNQIFGSADTTMSRPLTAFSGEYEYVNIAYNKGLLLFEAVRTACGDGKFESALKKYFAECSFRLVPPESLCAAFLPYADVEGVFNSFIEGKIII